MSDHIQTQIEIRFDRLERLLDTRFDQLDNRFEGLDDKVAHFTWLVGIQVTTLVAIVGALLARA